MSSKLLYCGDLPVIINDTLKDRELVSIGIVVNCGSVTENLANNGASHFLEHLVFKGTKSYTAKDISRVVEECGGYINAYTSKEQTAYYIRGFSGNVDKFLSVLMELVFFPELSDKEFDQEREVIINEIKSIKDNPEEYLMEMTEEEVFKGSTLELPISGTVDSVSGLTLDDLKNYHKTKYNPKDCAIVLSGDIDEKQIMRLLESYDLPEAGKNGHVKSENVFHKVSREIKMDTEQVYSNILFPTMDIIDDRRYELLALNFAVGGLMSSRLFQKVREDMGLCYSIESDISLYRDNGYLSIFFNSMSSSYKEVIDVIADECEKVRRFGLTEKEVETAKNQLRFAFLTGCQTVDSLMFRNMKNYFYYNRIFEDSELTEKIEAIDKKSLDKLAEEIFSKESSICSLLP